MAMTRREFEQAVGKEADHIVWRMPRYSTIGLASHHASEVRAEYFETVGKQVLAAIGTLRAQDEEQPGEG